MGAQSKNRTAGNRERGGADIVMAKKTQRDKDWHMIRRLLEADMYKAADNPYHETIAFWLAECRTPELLVALAAEYPDVASDAGRRALLDSAVQGDSGSL